MRRCAEWSSDCLPSGWAGLAGHNRRFHMNLGFWELILGLMATMFGGFALCYGLVKLGEKVVHKFRVQHAVPASVPPLRRAA